MVIYLNKQKIVTLSAAAVLADEYALTHKTVFPSLSRTTVNTANPSPSPSVKSSNPPREDRDFFHCHRPGHVIANSLALKRKEQAQTKPTLLPTKGVGFVEGTTVSNISCLMD